jgi:hypothetical protein
MNICWLSIVNLLNLFITFNPINLDFGLFVDSQGKRTRAKNVEWEKVPMEFGKQILKLILKFYFSLYGAIPLHCLL